MTEWRALHLYYHSDLDRLLTELVAPLIHEFRADGVLSSWFFLRYWDRGNHLRLRLAGPDLDQSVLIRERARHAATDYLRDHPSARSMPADQYRRLAEVFAAAEGIAKGAGEQLPDNTVLDADYRPEHVRYGSGPTLAAVEDHFVVSSDIALRMVSAGTGEAERQTACLGFLLAAWRTAIPCPAQLESFAEVLFESWRRRLGSRVAPERESVFAAQYGHQRDRLLAARTGPADPVTAIWTRSLEYVADAVRRAGTAFTPALRPGWAGLVNPGDDGVAVLSVLDLCAHLICNRLGVSMVQESYLRFVAASHIRELQEVR